MRYGSLCSGIEAASVAWEPLGWQPAWFAEIEPFPSAVLAHHWPHVPNHGDMTLLVGKILSGAVEAPDILVGGTPCQAFSVAGLRGSLDDERGKFIATGDELRLLQQTADRFKAALEMAAWKHYVRAIKESEPILDAEAHRKRKKQEG